MIEDSFKFHKLETMIKLFRNVLPKIVKKKKTNSFDQAFFFKNLMTTVEESDQNDFNILNKLNKSLLNEEIEKLKHLRNIGISAHIDSGKTTFTERVLYYTGKIKLIHEVRGKDSIGAKMDFMELEREKGITIQSASTFCTWKKNDKDYNINIIDTPGHIDFTIEVERALRVLDGAVLVVCAVSGVQSQTITVDRQMKRYKIPRITFINKMDRMGSNPFSVVDNITKKLNISACLVQIPIGSDENFKGVVDIINNVSIFNDGSKGEIIRSEKVSDDLKQLVQEKRNLLIETLANLDDVIADIYLDGKIPSVEQIKSSIRRVTLARKFTPVFMGSALSNKCVQCVLDGVIDYLPLPHESLNHGFDFTSEKEKKVYLTPSSTLPFIGLVFKIEESHFGQLAYVRVYQGKLKKGLQIVHVNSGKKLKVPRLVKMHSNEMKDVDEVGPGEICATFGVDCFSGDTFVGADLDKKIKTSSIFVPEPVVSLSIKPLTNEKNFMKATNKFQKEDPTFFVKYDSESKETLILGMGELHLEIYVERLRREYNVNCVTGKPRVAFRESILSNHLFDYTHKKQTGGAGQYARIIGEMKPIKTENKFTHHVVGGKISDKFLQSCAKTFKTCLESGPLIGSPVLGVHMHITDGQTHLVDSSELSFRLATIGAFKSAFLKSQPIIMEPIMNVEITAPSEFQGSVLNLINKIGGIIIDNNVFSDYVMFQIDCSLNSLFGLSSLLRAATQGKGEFSMEFSKYTQCSPHLQEKLVSEYQLEQQKKK